MPSSPDSGPISTLTFWLSTSRRASATALSGVASEQPKERLTGRPAIVAPETPACGALPVALPPAPLISAYFAPENASASNRANGPPHVASTPILIALTLFELPGAGAAAAVVRAGAELDELLLFDPHPTTSSAATAVIADAAIRPAPPRRSHIRTAIDHSSYRVEDTTR